MNSPNSDETRQSTWLDVAVFATALVVGVVLYFAIRLWSSKHSQVIVTITLIVLMGIYAIVVSAVPRLRVRMDQAGDNAYYLGLLFTLTSMAFALYDFGALADANVPSAGVRQIIANFGIALGTTITGISLRVVLHQMRIDPADLEAVTRIELTEAAERLRTRLETVNTDLGRFHLEMLQRHGDTIVEVGKKVNAVTEVLATQVSSSVQGLIESTTKVHSEALEATGQITRTVTNLANEAVGAFERLRAVQPPPLALSNRLVKLGVVLEQVTTQGERTNASLFETAQGLLAALTSAEQTEKRIADVVTQVEGAQAVTAKQLGDALARLDRDMQPFGAGLKTALNDLRDLQEQLKEATSLSTTAHKAAVDVLGSLTKVARDVTAVVRTA